MKTYMVKEIFYSIQGEGVRAGIPHVFVRFAGCNLDCNDETMGWKCDTDFAGGTAYSDAALVDEIRRVGGTCQWVLLTGGEPTLQADQMLVNLLRTFGYRLAIETNGTRSVPSGIDWICCSPKYGRIDLVEANEVKYVLAAGQKPGWFPAPNRLVSPAFKGAEPDPDAIAWCVQWVLDHPDWRLSTQNHKWWGVR